jgi:hypothetical protein
VDCTDLSSINIADHGILQHFFNDTDYNKNPGNNANYHDYSGSDCPNHHNLNGTYSDNFGNNHS